MYRSNKVGVKELIIFLDDVLHCIINDNENAAATIHEISDIFPDKIVRVEKRGGET